MEDQRLFDVEDFCIPFWDTLVGCACEEVEEDTLRDGVTRFCSAGVAVGTGDCSTSVFYFRCDRLWYFVNFLS